MRIALLLLLLAGCEDRFRYYCQDPDNFNSPRCQKPRCEFNQDCPEYLVAPVMEKKIEGTTATPANPQQQPATNCR
jgi:hypothetical protein